MLVPPFDEKDAVVLPSILPAAIPVQDDLIQPRQSRAAIDRYLRVEICTPRLDEIQRHLHFAGLPRLARPLHRQRLMGREILVTEDTDEHLVWYQSRIFIKPLNRWMLDWDFWTEHICLDAQLHAAACGFLLSYMWLVGRESDLAMGKELHLLPYDLTWAQWATFQDSFLRYVDAASLHQVSPRYLYGELRLTRLNKIYRWVPSVVSCRRFVTGYLPPSTWYQEYFRQHYGWLLAVFVYFTVALAALQLGLATPGLQEAAEFQRAAYGFTAFSLVFVIAMVVILAITWLALTLFHYISAKIYQRKVVRRRGRKSPQTTVNGGGPGV